MPSNRTRPEFAPGGPYHGLGDPPAPHVQPKGISLVDLSRADDVPVSASDAEMYPLDAKLRIVYLLTREYGGDIDALAHDSRVPAQLIEQWREQAERGELRPVVDDDPASMPEGIDAQLEFLTEQALRALQPRIRSMSGKELGGLVKQLQEVSLQRQGRLGSITISAMPLGHDERLSRIEALMQMAQERQKALEAGADAD